MDFGANKKDDYDHFDAKSNMEKMHGKQAGDPVKGARAMYEVATMQDPPLRCVIGSDAYQWMNKKLDTYGESVKKFEKLSNSTDVDE